MLTIDEAIAHAREVAEEQRELFRLCPYPSQECKGADICKCLKNKHDGCIKCAKEHEQLAEWLEELKMYRESSYGELYSMVYNKAIDDFVKASRDVVYNYYTKQAYIKYDDFCKIAEQLKEGGNDE